MLPTQPYDVTPENLAKDDTNEESAHDDADRNRRYAYSSNRLFILSHHSYPYYHITNTMRSTEGSGSHWVAVVVEIEKKIARSEATAAAAGTAERQHETPGVYAPKKKDSPVKDAHGDSLSQELFASSSSSSSFSISTATMAERQHETPGVYAPKKKIHR